MGDIQRTIVQASKDIKNPDVSFYFDSKPRVVVGELSGSMDVLSFECHGYHIRVTTTIDNLNGVEDIPFAEISDELVAEKVKSFLRLAFDLSH